MHVAALEGREVFEVSCGTFHSLVLTKKSDSSGGKVYSFGLGNHGRLGYPKQEGVPLPEDPDVEESWFADKPYRVRFGDEKTKVARISCGGDHSLALTDHGEVYVFGRGKSGVLGLGNAECVWHPQKLDLVFHNEEEFVTHLGAGNRHSMCCTRRGHVWTWGSGANGRLGHGDTKTLASPEIVKELLSEMIVFVSAGDAHSAALDRNGRVYTWGQGIGGKLGHGDEADRLVPVLVAELEGVVIAQISCGGSHTLALSESNELYAWGSGVAAGFVSQGEGQRGVMTPVKVADLGEDVITMAAGVSHSLAVTASGNVLSWGRGERGRLGHADDSDQPVPKPVAELRGRAFVKDFLLQRRLGAKTRSTNFSKSISKSLRFTPGRRLATCVRIACGRSHTLVLTGEHEAYGFGSNVKGQIGAADKQEEYLEPVRVDLPEGTRVRALSAGERHSVFVTEGGDVYVCGGGDLGQLGLGQPSRQFSPVKVPKIVGCIDCACGPDYTALLLAPRAAVGTKVTAGDLWTCGSCESGKLGHPSITSDCILAPKKVSLKSMVNAVACGTSHMAAIITTGELLTWGAGSSGRLGHGITQNCFEPTPVMAPPNSVFVQVACGDRHTIALTNQNVVYVCGWGAAIAAVTDITVPTNFELQLAQPEGQPKITSLYAGLNHSAAVTNLGKVMKCTRQLN
eukprot:Gregarina_sp_Poly_1__6063@NODE_31_length_19375_cov_31_776984_g28_i0_p2_GENE_NODE_31_length_19375_cov_31_776984_g28_i0NODE_31_length_19375_cov_31_776984_g28_i0_p2_ORF_typecomplete_len683_score100_28RCC1/PF00415_18/0_027RCC1/PF00415_18/5_8e11RCC1/PF00415_18/1_5e08RCC1/PF00415_18/8_3e14RCC1/PF00415_18/1_9e17RCC1/PF00415_18/0_011RCC1/PF00415_18/2_6e12RCC1/PF00415_18/2e08RCC1/PF00415_18/2_2e08RCC1/PF00415_18/1_7e08RCC1/PF00415_18/3_1e16RCC1/PF00415_18/15RCC1_2/PF13540_6/0_0025RCC1_2/PF13540_6/2_3e06R